MFTCTLASPVGEIEETCSTRNCAFGRTLHGQNTLPERMQEACLRCTRHPRMPAVHGDLRAQLWLLSLHQWYPVKTQSSQCPEALPQSVGKL